MLITKSLLQALIPNWQGKLAVHHVSYLANGQVHRGVPYYALDPKIILTKLTLMKSIGVDTVISTWQGPWASDSHQDSIMTCMACQEVGMTFALLLDPGGMQKWVVSTPTQITANVEAALSDAGTQAMLTSSAYVPEKFILDFNTGANLVTLAAQFPSLAFYAQSVHFSWPMIPWNQTAYAGMNSLATMKIPGICSYFNDAGYPLPGGPSMSMSSWVAAGSQRNWGSSVWNNAQGARVLEHQGGQFFMNQIPTIQPSSPYIAVVTWDDYDEQSSWPLEAVVAAASGVNWSAL